MNITALTEIAREAGQKIMEIYNSNNFDIEYKEDNSPLTKADTASHSLIKERLKNLAPEIPIISEEGKNVLYEQRKNWQEFWLVDPLDGTKEFIKRNGEFTVNIALIKNNKSVLGVIYAPALDVIYFADSPNGAFKQMNGRPPEAIYTNSSSQDKLIAVQSRSHSSSAENEFLSRYSITESISKGSSLKFCLVAEGKADIYYRSGPTWEWDTAAGQAILTIAGGKIMTGNKELEYNKPTLKNDHGFACFANKILLNM